VTDRLARVLAHPLRDRVLFEYRDAPACPSDVARRLDRPLNLVSYHTAVLARHGCLELVRTERRRGALTRFYRCTVDQAIGPGDWIGVPVPLRRALALDTLGRLEAEARAAALAGGFDGEAAHLTRIVLGLDAAGVRAAGDALWRAFAELSEIADDARARGGAREPYEVGILAFPAGPANEHRLHPRGG
jgi:hypothetical protein